MQFIRSKRVSEGKGYDLRVWSIEMCMVFTSGACPLVLNLATLCHYEFIYSGHMTLGKPSTMTMYAVSSNHDQSRVTLVWCFSHEGDV